MLPCTRSGVIQKWCAYDSDCPTEVTENSFFFFFNCKTSCFYVSLSNLKNNKHKCVLLSHFIKLQLNYTKPKYYLPKKIYYWSGCSTDNWTNRQLQQLLQNSAELEHSFLFTTLFPCHVMFLVCTLMLRDALDDSYLTTWLYLMIWRGRAVAAPSLCLKTMLII